MREEVPLAAVTALARTQAELFAEVTSGPATGRSDGVEVFSAPGESRECVEGIARLLHRHAEQGTRSTGWPCCCAPRSSIALILEEAFRRAAIPVHFARGTPGARSRRARLSCLARLRVGWPVRVALRGVPLNRRGSARHIGRRASFRHRGNRPLGAPRRRADRPPGAFRDSLRRSAARGRAWAGGRRDSTSSPWRLERCARRGSGSGSSSTPPSWAVLIGGDEGSTGWPTTFD